MMDTSGLFNSPVTSASNNIILTPKFGDAENTSIQKSVEKGLTHIMNTPTSSNSLVNSVFNNIIIIPNFGKATPTEKTGIPKPAGKRHTRSRPCFFCGQFNSNLIRHLTTKHKKEEEVMHCMKLPKKSQIEAFHVLRKKGLLRYNKKEMAKDVPQYERQQVSTDKDIVMCDSCSGFYSRRYFCRHKKTCIGDLAVMPKAMPIEVLQSHLEKVRADFKEQILSRFLLDEVGQLCISDPTIVQFGSRLYEKLKSKKDKQSEVKKSVMADMRRIGHLFLKFRLLVTSGSGSVSTCSSAADMLVRRNFSCLVDAIEAYTIAEKPGEKSGLKINLYYLLKKMAKIQKATHLMNDNDSAASEIEKFQEVLSLSYNQIFGDAVYHLNRKRHIKLRRPQQMPSEDQVSKLKTYTVNRISTILNDPFILWNSLCYTELRDLTVSRLTLFNARRGGEPSRMSLTEWDDADNSVWLDPLRQQAMTESEVSLFQGMKLTYQGGKGNNHLVPILIPHDTIHAMRTLSNKEVRVMSDVSGSNEYMFPCTQQSDTHVGGWHAVKRICVDAQIENHEMLTATKMRHRISTIYAAIDVPEADRPFFYKHMGHSAEINAHIYQAPLAESEILKVGVHLVAMDGAYVKPLQTNVVESLSVLRKSNAPSTSYVLSTGENAECIIDDIPLNKNILDASINTVNDSLKKKGTNL